LGKLLEHSSFECRGKCVVNFFPNFLQLREALLPERQMPPQDKQTRTAGDLPLTCPLEVVRRL
jgi:hypothetical protein